MSVYSSDNAYTEKEYFFMYSRKFNNSEPLSIPSDYSGVAYSPQGIAGQNNINTPQEDTAVQVDNNLGNVPRVPFDELSTSMRAPATRHGNANGNSHYGMPVRSPHEQNNFDTAVPVMSRGAYDDRNRGYTPYRQNTERASPPCSDDGDYSGCRWGDSCEYPRKERFFDGKISDGPKKDTKGKKSSGLLGSLTSLTKHSFSMEDIILAGLILLLLSDQNADMDIILVLGFLLLIGL